jgi:hypothetical protein
MNVWIAVRSDGVAGTGTQNDPFDGSQGKFDSVMNALPMPISGINYSGSTAIVTAISHGFSNGTSVLIAGVTNSSLYNGTFTITYDDAENGYFVVTAVLSRSNPTVFQFQYVLPGNPGGPSDSGYYGRLWTGGRIVEENNVMDLAPSQTEVGSSAGVSLGDGVSVSPVLFPQVLLRRNIMRQVDDISDPPYTPANYASQGISVQACGTFTAEENVIDLPAAHNVQQRYCGSTEFFANMTSAGALIPGYDLGTSSSTNELSTNIDDAAVLAF